MSLPVINSDNYTPFSKVKASEDKEKVPDVVIYDDLFSGKISELMQEHLRDLHYKTTQYCLFNKLTTSPRKMIWFADNPDWTYVFSKNHMYGLQANPFPEFINCVKNGVEQLLNTKFNACLVNVYEGGSNSISWHDDNDPWLGKSFLVPSISFGQVRKFKLWNKENNKKFSIDTKDGSMIVMRESVQEYWKHSIPRDKSATGVRYNLTFRYVHPDLVSKMPKARTSCVEIDWRFLLRQEPVMEAIVKHLSKRDIGKLALTEKEQLSNVKKNIFAQLKVANTIDDVLKILVKIKDDKGLKEAFELLGKNRKNLVHIFEEACGLGNMKIIKILHEDFKITRDEVIRKDLNTIGQGFVVPGFFSFTPLYDQGANALGEACQNGHLKVVKYLREKLGVTKEDAQAGDNHALRWACRGGHLDIVKYLHKEFGLTKSDAQAGDNYALQFACNFGHLGVVEYLHKEFGLTKSDAQAGDNLALRLACRGGHLDVVKYLRDEFGIEENC